MWRVHAQGLGNLHEVGMLSQADSATNESTERLEWGTAQKVQRKRQTRSRRCKTPVILQSWARAVGESEPCPHSFDRSVLSF